MFLILVLQLVGGIMKVVNIYGKRYHKLTLQWSDAYNHVIKAFRELGYAVHLDPELQLDTVPEYVEVGFEHSDDAIYVYNHTYLDQIKKDNLPTGAKTFFIKPTAFAFATKTIASIRNSSNALGLSGASGGTSKYVSTKSFISVCHLTPLAIRLC